MSPTQFGLVSSSYTLGGLFGALLAGPFATSYGPLITLRTTAFVFILGALCEAVASLFSALCFGRFLSGIAAGAAIVVGPIFIAQVAPPNKKGLFGAFTQVMTNVGILIAQTLGYFLSRDNLWRVILGVAAIIGILEFAGLFFVPESPTWLAERGKLDHARRILQKIRGRGTDIEPEIRRWKASSPGGPGEEESLLSPEANNHAKNTSVSILGAAKDPVYRPAIIAVVAVMITQQFTGINSIIMYSVSLLSTVLPTTASLLAVIVSAINLITTLICSPLADKLGRRVCLLLSITGMGINSMLLAVSIAYDIKFLSAVATLLFVASFAVGLGPVPFILASELVGPEAVGATQSWALAANWIATFVVAQFFPVLNETMGGQGRVYWVFAALAVVLGSFLAWWVPETKGKESMEEVWGVVNRRID